MALKNRTDLDEVRATLRSWLAERVEDPEVGSVEVPQSSGMSNETVLFDASWREDSERCDQRMVVRMAPMGPAVFPSYDLETEFRVMSALDEHTTVPVPKMRWHEPDADVLGGPFLVMDRVDGRVPVDDPPFTTGGWVLDLAPEEQGRLNDNGLQVLADLHGVDYEALGLGFLGRGLEHQLAYYEHFYEWAEEDGRTSPTIDAGFEWVRGHLPSEEQLVLSWGDARIGNMIFRDDLSVGAVLDWEMVCLGDPAMELGWWLFMHRHHTEGVGAPSPPGFPTSEETVARYEALSGHTISDLHFYEAFGALRLSIMMFRAGHLMIAAGQLPPDATMFLNNPASQILARLLDLPAPEGQVESFLGNR